MRQPNWSKVRCILERELRDQLRDRRTLFMVAVLPLLLYPLLGIGMLQVTQFFKKHPTRMLAVTATDDSSAATFADHLQAAADELLTVDWQTWPAIDPVKMEPWAAELIQQGRYDLVVAACAATSSTESRDTGENGTANPQVVPLVWYDAAKDRCQMAHQRVMPLIDDWQRPASVAASAPVLLAPAETVTSLRVTDLSSADGKRAAIWSKILPFVVFVWALTGAFYPAVDLCAGEKERGTLETLLCSAADRLDIVWGKLLTVMIFSTATALLNMVCMVGTAYFVMQQFAYLAPDPSLIVWGLPPWTAICWLVVALIPVTALFSSLALALASMARSTKEGQYYLLPMIMVFTPLLLLAMLPAARLDMGTSLLPITGIMLFLRHAMEGDSVQVLSYALPVLLVTGGCCVLSIRWAVDQFNHEHVLFPSSERFSLSLWARQLFRNRGATPTAMQALLCGLIILLIRFFLGSVLGYPATWSEFAVYTICTLLAFVASPALLMTAVFTRDPRQTLLWIRPPRHAIVAAMLLAVCLHPAATALLAIVRFVYPLDASSLAPLESLFAEAPSWWSLLFLLALLPALCEELAFRGFILTGLRQLHSRWQAIAISTALFAIAHGVIQQSLVAGVFGLILGYLALQTGSLFPCIAFHATHNALGLLAGSWMPRLGTQANVQGWLIETIPSVSGQDVQYVYGIALLLPALLAAALLLNWFREEGDRRQESGVRSQESGVRRQETGD